MKTAKYLILGLAIYAAIAISAYRFKNPSLTETQLLMKLPSALIWDRS